MKSDYSVFSLFTAGLACIAPLTSAYTHPKGPVPKGNPIALPGLNSLVPAGKPYTVTWQPTTKGPVTLLLLKGPSTDAEPLGIIAENIPNSGKYVWHVSDQIEPSANNQPEGYGIQLIVDKTGQYQYTTQFGISNPNYKPGDHWGNLGNPGSSSSSSIMSSTHTSPHSYHSTTSPQSYQHTTTSPQSYQHTTTSPQSYQHTTTSPQGYPTSSHHTSSNATSTSWRSHPLNLTSVSSIISTLVPPTPSSSWSSGVVPTRSTNGTGPTTTSSPPPMNGAPSSFASSFVGIIVAAGVAIFAI